MSDFHVDQDARRDLSEIFRHIAKDNLPAADRLRDKFYDQFFCLARNPQLGQLRPELAEDLRRVSVGNYVSFTRPRVGFVEIVRVIHGARDVDAIFPGEGQ
jgi:toxin ParE1/3/4